MCFCRHFRAFLRQKRTFCTPVPVKHLVSDNNLLSSRTELLTHFYEPQRHKEHKDTSLKTPFVTFVTFVVKNIQLILSRYLIGRLHFNTRLLVLIQILPQIAFALLLNHEICLA